MHISKQGKTSISLSALSYACKLWEAIDTPVSLSLYILSKYKQYKDIVSYSIDPLDYTCPSAFAKDYQASKLLSKYPYLDTGIDKKAVAFSKFTECEKTCLETNTRFRARADEDKLFDPRVERVLFHASRKIASILGPVPSLDKLVFLFGPGATLGVRGDTSVFQKVSSTLECTPQLAHIAPDFLSEFPGWIPPGENTISVVNGSELTFVPKDAKTDRPICIEPLLNGLYQKGFGSYIRDRLRRHGVDLRDQGVNQKLASLAHSHGLATVDFSSASDTIAYNVVLDLLPIDWFLALDVARSPSYFYEGSWKPFHKFSSMGNAYTFELESLIFYALAFACAIESNCQVQTGSNLSVYGDDVIIPRHAFDLFREVTEICGFTINEAKSYKDGAFFESCGQDFFLGRNVRPFLIKRKLNTLLGANYAANTITRIASRQEAILIDGSTRNLLLRLYDAFSWCVGRIPVFHRVFGPEGYGDGHIVESLSNAPTRGRNRVSRHRHFDGWVFPSYADRSRKIRITDSPMSYALYFTATCLGEESPVNLRFSHKLPVVSEPSNNGSEYSLRNITSTHRSRLLCHYEWPDTVFQKYLT
jgi:hypothetical protein